MALIRDIAFGAYVESRHAPDEIREQNRQVNWLSVHIADAFLIELREHGFSAGRVQKIIIELRRKFQTRPDGRENVFENMVDVVRYNIIFDFRAYLASPKRVRGAILIECLYCGFLKVCEILDIDSEPVNLAYQGIVKDDFVYKYIEGKPVQRKKLDLEAQIVSAVAVLLPSERTVLGSEIKEISSGKFFGSCVFYKGIRLYEYKGKLKWVSENTLRFDPKDVSIKPCECLIDKGESFSDNLRILTRDIL
jgi:hypothetical protein